MKSAKALAVLGALLEDHQKTEPHHEDMCRLCRDASALLQRLPPKRSVRAARKTKAKKDKVHAEDTSAIRAIVFDRAHGRCEMCKGAEPTDLQHCLGRVKRPQAVGNCLAICRPCHREATKKTHEALGLQIARLVAMGHLDAAKDLALLQRWLKSKAEARQKMTARRAAALSREATR